MADECDDGLEKDGLIRRYIQSFQWRDDSTVSRKEFLELLQKYEADIEDVWKILIGNSVKTAHPLNAEFLHELLMGYELNERDYLWTLYINNIFSDETNRITQLIQDYVRGEPVAMKSKKQILAFICLFITLTSLGKEVSGNISSSYTWKNVAIGGGGYVTGIAVHPRYKDLVYIRTDIGGAYRWNEQGKNWIPLTDWIGFGESNLYGIDGIAVDPNDKNVVYMAAGKYENALPHDVLKSVDGGKNWVKTGLFQ